MAAAAVCAIVLLDLYPVGKRYLDKDDFVTKKNFSSQFAERPVDKMIHEDSDLGYRVLDISVNTFNDAHQSYHHRCIGGYSPAKMQRYQDLIERYLGSEINSAVRTINGAQTIQDAEDALPYLPVTSMLNGKYIIAGGEYPPVRNRFALGNAWFIDSAVQAETPDDEIALLGSANLHDTAVIGRDFSWAADKIDEMRSCMADVNKSAGNAIETEDTIEMVSYAANELRYRYNISSDRAVIFSEIYYPDGWKAWIGPSGDAQAGKGTETDLFRADWILRGAILPAGEGELIMRFEPQSYKTGAALSRASSITLLVLLLLSAGCMAATAVRTKRE